MSVLCQHHERVAGGEASRWQVRPLLNDSCPVCVVESALDKATRGCDSLLWLANNLHNYGSDAFLHFLKGAIEDARAGHEAGVKILGDGPRSANDRQHPFERRLPQA